MGRGGLHGRVGRYQIAREIGRGGMGVVYEGWDPQLHRRVAIKVLRDHTDAQTLDRMAREARAVAALSHPNVVQIFDVSLGCDRAFIVMEFVAGLTLRQWIRAERPAWPLLLRAYRQAGRGLAAAHAVGLVHRDFKPSNAIIDCNGDVKVLDFGLARADGERSTPMHGDTPMPSSGATLTATGIAMGTPSYMAPEQHRGERVDARADVYGFGIALYEALYGQLPFVAPTVDDLYFDKSLGLDPPPADASVPASIHEAIRKALAWEPAERWGSMDELLAALERRPPRRRPWVAVAGLVAAVGLASALLVELPDAAPEAEATAIDPRLQADVERLLVAAEADGHEDRPARGLGHAAAALTLAAASGSPRLMARAEIQVGGSLLDNEQFEPSIAWLHLGIEHARVVGEDRAAAVGSVRAIYALGEAGRPHDALAAGREARSLAERVGDDGTLLVRILENEAAALPEGVDGLRRLEQALAIRRANPKLGKPRALAMTLTNLGHSLSGIDAERARRLQLEALQIRERVLGSDHRDTLDIALTLADLDRIAGEFSRCTERAVDVHSRLHPSHRRHRTEAATIAAMCLNGQGRIARGLAWIERALADHPDRTTESGRYAVALEVKAALLSARGDAAEAEALLQHTLTIRESAAKGPDPWVASSYHNLAFVARQRGELDRAETYARRSIDGFAATVSLTGLIRARTELAAVLLARGRFDEVLDVLADDLDVPIDPGPPIDPMLIALARGQYARALFEVDEDGERALELAQHALDALARRDAYRPEYDELLWWWQSRARE